MRTETGPAAMQDVESPVSVSIGHLRTRHTHWADRALQVPSGVGVALNNNNVWASAMTILSGPSSLYWVCDQLRSFYWIPIPLEPCPRSTVDGQGR